MPARAQISRTLGRDQRAFHALAAGAGLRLWNDTQGLDARFDAAGVEVRSGPTRLHLSLRALGYGNTLAPVQAAAPEARFNRVSYARGPLTEWYLNGPLGLEQGFTLRRAPEGGNGPLTVELALAGARATLLPERTGVSFAGSSLRYRGLFALDAAGTRLPAWLELAKHRLLVRVDDAGARYPLTIDPFVQQAKLVAAEAAADDFGTSVAVAGDTVVVGADGAMVGGSGSRGAVYVFVKPGSGWANGTQTAKLTASDGISSDLLGNSVAISSDTIVAGAKGDDSSRGAVYVFVKPGGGWTSGTQTAKLTASDGVAGDTLGWSVAISGDTVVAGANNARPGGDLARGAAYVFVKPGGGWTTAPETAKLTASDGAQLAQLGRSVAVSGDTVVAGAPYAKIGSVLGQGAAYVFVKPGVDWVSGTQTAKLTASDGTDDDNLGSGVTADADTIVAGALGADIGGNDDQGAAYVFLKPGGGWINGNEAAKLNASDGAAGDFLGFSVDVSGDTVVAGAHLAQIGGNGLQGAAYIFVKPGGGWVSGTQTAKLTSSDGAPVDAFGWSVAIDGGTIVAGARLANVGGNTDEGAAYVFVKPGGVWATGTQTAKLVAAGGEDDQLGFSVAIAGDTVVAGAPNALVGIFPQGAAYVFVKPAGGWAGGIQTAKLTASSGLQDQVGFSVAVSGDTVVVGAPSVSGGGVQRGAAYVFVKPGGGWTSATQTAKLTASDAGNSDQLGTSVAVSGDTVVAGASGDDTNRGAAYVFVKPAGAWASGTETGKLTASDGVAQDKLGTSVGVSGDTLVAGASGDDTNRGAAYVFVKPAGAWASGTETGKLTASDGVANDKLGQSVGVSGDTVVAGASGDDSGRGAAYVFVKPGAAWASGAQTAKLTASDGAASDTLGQSVAGDASTVVAGAKGDDGSRGAAYVFVKPDGGWATGTETSKLTASDGVAGDSLGQSVGVSGNSVVVGAQLANVGSSSDEGAAYVFQSAGTTSVRLLAFSARRTADGVVLRWQTASEGEAAGFNVFRSGPGGTLKVNRSPFHANGISGGTYRLLDRTARKGVNYRYRLQVVNRDGTRSWSGTLRAC